MRVCACVFVCVCVCVCVLVNACVVCMRVRGMPTCMHNNNNYQLSLSCRAAYAKGIGCSEAQEMVTITEFQIVRETIW